MTGQNTLDEQFLANRICIITLVGKKHPGSVDWHCQQIGNSDVIGDLPTRQDKTKRTVLTVRAGIDFAPKTAA
jgi:hypothetical protein